MKNINDVTKILGTKYPLIQAPMSWLTNAQFVAAVSNSGAFGILGPHAGQQESPHDPMIATEEMRNEIKKTRKLTNKPFGINVIAPPVGQKVSDTRYTRELLDMAFEENVKYFAIVGEAHKELFEKIRQHQGIIIFRPLTPTVDQMKLGELYGADILVATGSDEGGVLPQQEYGTFTVVPEMADAVNVPVLAAGGINDHRGVNAAFALGAQGVYIGTRFLITDESPMDEKAKELVIKSNQGNLERVSNTQKSLHTAQSKIYNSQFIQGNEDVDMQISKHEGVKPGMLNGDLNTGIVSVNNGIGIIKNVIPVHSLVEELMSDIDVDPHI